MNQAPSGVMRWDWRIPSDMSTLDAALVYLHGGAKPVFVHGVVNGKCTCKKPDCRSIGKHPILPGWQKNIAKDEIALRDQASRLRVQSPNIGVVLGEQPNGEYLVAIDIDDAERFAVLTKEFGDLPPTPRCDSGRGYRLFYRLPAAIPTQRMKNVTGAGGAPGVDAKAEAGQVVVGPSRHFLGGQYAWSVSGEILELPMSWVSLLVEEPKPPPFVREYTPETMRADSRAKKKAEKYLERAVIEECSLLARMPEGQRNTYLYKKTISLLALVNGCFLPARWGYVLGELHHAAKASGLGETEIRKTLTSAELFVTREGATRGPRPVTEFTGAEESSSSGVSPSVPPPSNGLRQDRGQNAAIASNVARLLRTHEDWKGGPRLDKFGYVVQWPAPLPEPLKEIDRMHGHISDVDASEVQDWCVEHQVRVKLEAVRDGIALAASKNSFDSLVSYVNALPQHDGKLRLDTWLSVYFGAENNLVTRRIGRAWLMSSLARALQPGCVADAMLILEGEEGTGKNWGIEELFGAERVGQLGVYQIGKHKEADRMAGMFWVLHDDELRSLRKQSKGTIFSWLTRKADTYRLEWAREIRTYARRAILVGSKNPPYDYLDDDENRRYWPVRTGRINVPAIQQDREQLLAEALAAIKKGGSWIITKDDPIWNGLSEVRAGRAADDPMVMDVLLILPQDADVVTTRWVLNELGVPPDRRKTNEMTVAAALRAIGFIRQRMPRPVAGRPWTYEGRPWVYVRSGLTVDAGTRIYL